MSNCYNDLIANNQNKFEHMEYQLDGTYAAMDIGKKRKRQEDGVLILEHPHTVSTIIGIADGMGGLNNGADSSNLALRLLAEWYLSKTNLSINLRELDSLFNEIDYSVRNNCNGGGTTLSAAIIMPENTTFINIGDSRIYINDINNAFYQLSIDHSITWELFLNGSINKKDDMRFHKKNNLITSRLGCEKKKLTIDYFDYKTSDYDEIFLFTDGITDCVSDDKLSEIIHNSSKNEINNNIMYEALNSVSINYELDSENYYHEIDGGKDNASIVYYSRRRVRRL